MSSDCVYDPLNRFYKSITGAVPENKKITFRIKGDYPNAYFIWHKDGEKSYSLPMEKRGRFFQVSVSFSIGLFWYRFDISEGNFIGCDENVCGVITREPNDFQLSVYAKNFRTPKWTAGGIIYQIFPDRFYRSDKAPANFDKTREIHKNLRDDPVFLPDENGEVRNDDFFGGDINGITEKLPFIKSLGVSIIYLNPIFKAFSNHRYDTGDFMQIDDLLGKESDLVNLIKKADDRGIKIMLDGVFNHVGDDSVYFNRYGNYPSVGAYNSVYSPYYKWFKFTDYPDKYESWWGVKTLPAVDENDASYADFVCGKKGVLAHYLKLGVKGFRLDVVDELPHVFVRKIRERVKSEDENAFIVGEVWEDASNKISYGVRREYFLGKELDSVMNYPLKNAVVDFVKNGNARALSDVIRMQTDHYPKMVLDGLMNVLSTHDTARLLSAVSDIDVSGKSKKELAEIRLSDSEKETAVIRLKAATLLQYTLYGVPSVYYGDEIGMQGFFDPLNRKYFDWDDMDQEILFWYKLLGKIRRENSAFKNGTVKEIFRSNGVYVFERKAAKNDLLVAVNISKNKIRFGFKGEIINLIDGKIYNGGFVAGENFLGIFKKHDKNR